MENKSLLEIIEEDLRKKNAEGKAKRNTGLWHPSSLGRCYRLQCWQRDGVVESDPPDSRSLRLFECGHIFHDFLQRYLPAHQVEVACKIDDIAGRADIVTDDTVMDIKSQHSRAFFYMKSPKYDIKKEKFTNWLQVACYAYVLNKPKLRLIFVSKDDLCIAEYGDTLANWREALEEELKNLRYNWGEYKAGKLPKDEPRAYNGKDCSYCPFKTKCGKNLVGEQEKE